MKLQYSMFYSSPNHGILSTVTFVLIYYYRVEQTQRDVPVVDVHGSYLYKNISPLLKQESMLSHHFVLHHHHLAGELLTKMCSYQTVGSSIPTVTAGTDILHLKVICTSSS